MNESVNVNGQRGRGAEPGAADQSDAACGGVACCGNAVGLIKLHFAFPTVRGIFKKPSGIVASWQCGNVAMWPYGNAAPSPLNLHWAPPS